MKVHPTVEQVEEAAPPLSMCAILCFFGCCV
jgi:hypothetical protein